MAELAIIIGNGFDKDLGLPSGYPEFLKSDEWKKLEKTLSSFPTEDYLSHSLIYHLQTEAYIKKYWFDIEKEILQFIKNHPAYTREPTLLCKMSNPSHDWGKRQTTYSESISVFLE